ncbi:MAG: hypothetical protein JRJ84_16360 [Deltaproteobacteria bacterium]|nr:hypothetical protein [Deltaproteobacteria bacterium]
MSFAPTGFRPLTGIERPAMLRNAQNLVLFVPVLIACSPAAGRPPTAGDADTASSPDCALGLPCNPIPITSLPAVDTRDTTEAPGSEVDAYPCAPSTDESGPEFFYAVTVPTAGLLTATVEDDIGADIDLHLLRYTDPNSCLVRAHEALAWPVEAGSWILVADTWVDADGTAQAGTYTLTVDFLPLTGTACAMDPVDLRMYWSACAEGIDCFRAEEDGSTYSYLRTPAFGPVVKEAHLITPADDLPDGWPTSSWDGIEDHYALSTVASGYTMNRREPWAPDGEGNAHYGQGATGVPVPVLAEAWYVNMYWRDRPARGTPMLVINPFEKRAVVTAAGYETGPGANTAIGGVVEEVHHHLGTSHRDRLIMGFAADDTLELGPVDCW